ncbi:M20/M25/M40 family metallo-hydrolase [Streptomyces roseirectus]|uniref:M20/M25/M40 family metallo-hydrolase n=1 Tax=Streptomyces roseirectus TaxID=2768066 RepID=A0A7H0IRN1_9ACTN|nr:M20/M25/M40 family metallo-hydrolase [Streptomyces roseirectus]QNP75447.1 M20/M25/M40 family metallo-hydrolase [Streptomyces roseirectus]
MSPDRRTTPNPQETVDLLSALIRNACVNDGTPTPESGGEARNADTLDDYFSATSVETERLEPVPGRVTTLYRVPGHDPKAPALTLLGHTDVVPADPRTWSRAPFSGEVSDGIVWGRGAIDMLNLTSAMAVVTAAAARSPRRLAGDLVFAAVADEEAGSRHGVGWIAEHSPGLLPWDHALTETAGAHVGPRAVTVTVGEKGAFPRRLHIRGSSGHGSMPWGSDNAALLAAEAALRIARHRTPAHPDERWPDFVHAAHLPADVTTGLLDPDTLDDHLAHLGDSARFAHALTHLTFAPTVLKSGDTLNVIPSTAVVDIDVRSLPGQDDDDIDAELRRALGDLSARVEIEHLDRRTASASPASRLYDVVADAVRHQLPGTEVLPTLTTGGTDARFVRDAGGVAYGFGVYAPGWDVGKTRRLFHGDDEHIDTESLHLTTHALDEVIHTFLNNTP